MSLKSYDPLEISMIYGIETQAKDPVACPPEEEHFPLQGSGKGTATSLFFVLSCRPDCKILEGLQEGHCPGPANSAPPQPWDKVNSSQWLGNH